MIVLQFVLANLAENAATPLQELALLANHKSVGITIFMFAVIRLAWRVRQGTPNSLPMPEWQTMASRISHWFMYGLLFLMPVTGWLMSSASADSVSWFNVVPLPDLVAADPELKDTLETIHKTLAKVLFAVAAIHIAAAVKHSLINKDGAIARITSTAAIVLFFAVVALGVGTLTRVGDGSDNTAGPNAASSTTTVDTGASDLPGWNIDYTNSHIKFVATQAGADINGVWPEWSAVIRFDEAQLDAGLFDVSVAVAAVETLDVDRDRTLQDLEWFDAERFPKVRFQASRFNENPAGGFEAPGSLTVKGRSTPVTLEFSVVLENGRMVLDGQARLDRIALQVGIGEWADTRWIGQFVTVVVHVETIE